MPRKKSEPPKSPTHFEQVPLEIVKKIADPVTDKPKPDQKPVKDSR